MSDKIMTVYCTRIPLKVYAEILEHLRLPEPEKISAIKALRNCRANAEDAFVGDACSSVVLSLKECKHIIDWIQANPGLVFTNNYYALVPVSILGL